MGNKKEKDKGKPAITFHNRGQLQLFIGVLLLGLIYITLDRISFLGIILVLFAINNFKRYYAHTGDKKKYSRFKTMLYAGIGLFILLIFLTLMLPAEQDNYGFYECPDGSIAIDESSCYLPQKIEPREPIPEIKYTYVGEEPLTPEPLAECSSNLYNCADFSTQAQAQALFESCSYDVHKLDRDNDGVACEALP